MEAASFSEILNSYQVVGFHIPENGFPLPHTKISAVLEADTPLPPHNPHQ
jgi:hypothetical protein